MAIGSMKQFIQIVEPVVVQDAAGFKTSTETTVCNTRAYLEEQHGSVSWVNRAALSRATALFRFRKDPNYIITDKMVIINNGQRYKIESIEDTSQRGMYWEALVTKLTETEHNGEINL